MALFVGAGIGGGVGLGFGAEGGVGVGEEGGVGEGLGEGVIEIALFPVRIKCPPQPDAPAQATRRNTKSRGFAFIAS